MAESVVAQMTFIGGERSDTRSGKERYVLRTADGREFSCWSGSVFEAVMAHLHEQVNAKVYSKQDDGGRWWNTLDGLPDLGVEAPRKGQGQSGGQQATPLGQAVDMSMLVPPLDRIATALENLVAFKAESFLGGAGEEPPEDLDVGEEPPE